MIKLKNIMKENYIMELSLPPGIDDSNFEDWEEFENDPRNASPTSLEELRTGGANVKNADMDAIFQYKVARHKNPKLPIDPEMPYIHSYFLINKDGTTKDSETLRKEITVRPTYLLSQNTKIEHSGGKDYIFYNLTLPAYKGLIYDEKEHKFKIVTVCANANACKVYCYARSGGYVMFPNAYRKSARIINYIMNDWEGFKKQLLSEIKRAEMMNSKKGIQVVIRWHDSGDVIDNEYLEMAYDIAKQTPNVIHYAYTKNVSMVMSSSAPDNFVFNFSFGGKQDPLVPSTMKKFSIVVPEKYFSDEMTMKTIGKNKKLLYNNEKAIDTVKDSIASRYKVARDSMLTYNELMQIPYNKYTKHIPKWNVIVAPGDGDDAAMRKDVLGTFLLKH